MKEGIDAQLGIFNLFNCDAIRSLKVRACVHAYSEYKQDKLQSNKIQFVNKIAQLVQGEFHSLIAVWKKRVVIAV